MSLRFAVVYEAEADFQIATELADRVLLEAIEWLEDGQIEYQREWLFSVGTVRLLWRNINRLARDVGIRVHGHFDGEPAFPDAATARRAILYVLETVTDLDAILLIRDQDNEHTRRDGLAQARTQDYGIPIVVGLAIVERECWVISGFDPRDDAETSRIVAERQRLGYDPRLRSHDLTACKDDQAPHSPKRVLRELCRNDRERERCCWCDTTLSTLRDRGTENGLADYLHEVRVQFAPLIDHVS